MNHIPIRTHSGANIYVQEDLVASLSPDELHLMVERTAELMDDWLDRIEFVVTDYQQKEMIVHDALQAHA